MITIKDTKQMDSFFKKDSLYDKKRYQVHEVKLFGLTIYRTIEDMNMNIAAKNTESIGFIKKT